MMKVTMYVLHGSWDTQSADGVEVLGVSENIKPLQDRLEKIADSKAETYLETYGDFEEERGERLYEITDSIGEYAKFYITEHQVEISETLMGMISREMGKIDRHQDVRRYLQDLYEADNIPAWQYEYMTRKPDVMKEILELFDKFEDCNTPFNSTMDLAVENVRKEISLDDNVLEYLWEKFGDVLIDDDECILDDFIGFEYGTHREEVWHWFDAHHSKGVSFLMFGGEQ